MIPRRQSHPAQGQSSPGGVGLAVWAPPVARHGPPLGRLRQPPAVKIQQRGVQWKQGVVIYIMSCTVSLHNANPIHCTPLPLHPPLLNTQWDERAARARIQLRENPSGVNLSLAGCTQKHLQIPNCTQPGKTYVFCRCVDGILLVFCRCLDGAVCLDGVLLETCLYTPDRSSRRRQQQPRRPLDITV